MAWTCCGEMLSNSTRELASCVEWKFSCVLWTSTVLKKLNNSSLGTPVSVLPRVVDDLRLK